jgi:hypothetical protein
VTFIECTAQVLTEQDTTYCDPNTQLTTTTPAFGAVPTATFFAKRVLETGDGLVDCKARAGTCILLATSGGSGYIGGFVSTVGGAQAAASNHPSARAAANIPSNLNKQTLHAAAAQTKIPGLASTPLSFGP